MRKLQIVLLASLILSLPSRASAALIGYEFNGVVTSTYDNLAASMPGIDVGTSVTGSVVYSTTGGLEAAFNSLEIYFGDFRASSAIFNGGVSGDIGNFQVSGSFPITGPLTKVVSGDLMLLQFDLADTTSPVGSLRFQGLDFACFCGFDDTPGFYADITSVTPVPDSGSTFLSMVLGLLGVIGFRQYKGTFSTVK